MATADKISLIQGLAAAGVPEIEVTSFARPDVIPQLADADRVLAGVAGVPGHLRALVPNLKGAQRALAAGARSLVGVIGVSETFNQKNVGRSVADSVAELTQVVSTANARGVPVMLSVSTAFGCPYEGAVAPDAVTRLISAALRTDIGRIEVCDTIGAANPRQVHDLCVTLLREFPAIRLELHFHDTRGLALSNVLAAMDAGIKEFAGSLGGMGGCPFAPGATGNVCTLDLAHMLQAMGVRTGISVNGLVELARWLEQRLGHVLPGRVLRAGAWADRQT